MNTPPAVLITGCSSGLGRQTALALRRLGYPVYATARRPESIAELAAAGLTTLPLDVTDEGSMAAAVARVESDHGAVGVLINNAGYGLHAPIEEGTPEDFRRQFDTNVFGLVRMTQLVLPGMRGVGTGRVVNISSMAGRFSPPGGGFYHATKHAVEAISDSLRLEVKPFGIDVVVVQPGPTITEFGGTAIGTMHAAGAAGAYADFRVALAEMYRRSFRRRNLAVPVETAARTVVRAATTGRPRARYAIGVIARGTIIAKRVLPDPIFDAVVRSQFPVPKPAH